MWLRVALRRHVLLSVFKVARAVVHHGSRLVLVPIAADGPFLVPLAGLHLDDVAFVLKVLRVMVLLDLLPLKSFGVAHFRLFSMDHALRQIARGLDASSLLLLSFDTLRRCTCQLLSGGCEC